MKNRVITFEKMTRKDWLEVKLISRDLMSRGAYEKNRLQCDISAFLEWINNNGYKLAIEVSNGDPLH